MLQSFTEFNQEGLEIPIELNYPVRKKVLQELLLKYSNSSSRRGVKWVFNKKEIVLFDLEGSIQALPSTKLNFVVAVYSGSLSFRPPKNAVIYNLDGTIKSILTIPPFFSEKIKHRLAFLKQPNPPVNAACASEGLRFSGFAWRKLETGQIVDSMTISFERDAYEIRVLDVETEVFLGCLGSSMGMYSKS